VGDLVVIGEMYQHLQDRLSENGVSHSEVFELRKINTAFGELINSLQRSTMEIRKLPMRTVLQRIPRIVRDIASVSGKEIETHIEGESIMVDKTLIEALEAPLVHLIRNAADHGIERPDERLAAGKDRSGRIEVSARETADHIYLTLRDDGKGLDLDALIQKAISIGVITSDRKLMEAERVNLIFISGVSTAQTVSDLSGRGVGMDVVKRNIERAGGRITVSSSAGKGCEGFPFHQRNRWYGWADTDL